MVRHSCMTSSAETCWRRSWPPSVLTSRSRPYGCLGSVDTCVLSARKRHARRLCQAQSLMTEPAVLQVFLNGGNTMLLSGTGLPFQQSFQRFKSTFRWTMVSSVITLPGAPCLARARAA